MIKAREKQDDYKRYLKAIRSQFMLLRHSRFKDLKGYLKLLGLFEIDQKNFIDIVFCNLDHLESDSKADLCVLKTQLKRFLETNFNPSTGYDYKLQRETFRKSEWRFKLLSIL
jgi:hypothetical protein